MLMDNHMIGHKHYENRNNYETDTEFPIVTERQLRIRIQFTAIHTYKECSLVSGGPQHTEHVPASLFVYCAQWYK